MAEPDPDRGHVDGPAPDVVAFVVPGGDCAVLAELAESALDGVALLIGSGVEGGRAAAPAAALEPVLHLVRGFGDGRLDPAAAQVSADRGAGVRLVAQDPPRAGPGPARAPARDLELPHQGQEGHRVVALPGAGQPRQRPAPAVSEQVDLAGQPAPGPAQRLRFLSFSSPPGGVPACSAWPAPAGPGPHPRAARAAPRPHAGAPAPPSRPPQPSPPGPPPRRTRRAAGPGSPPRSRPQASGGAPRR